MMNAKQPIVESIESRRLFSAALAPAWIPTFREPAAFFFAPPVFADVALTASGGATFLSPQPPATAVAASAGSTAAISQAVSAPPTVTPVSTAAAAVAAQPIASSVGVAPVSFAPSTDLKVSSVADAISPISASAGLTSVVAAAPPLAASANAVAPALAADTSWATAAAAAKADLLSLNATLLGNSGAAALRQEVGAWATEFEHVINHVSLPGVADTFVHALVSDVALVTAGAEHLFAAGLHHSELVEALAAIFAGGAFSAGWLASRDDEPAEVHAPRAAFCDDLIGFGHAMA